MIRIGTAEVDITPPVNVPMVGYGARKSGSRGTHDPITARAIVFDNGRARVAWIIADLLGVSLEQSTLIRKLGGEAAGIAEEAIMFSSTHNHGGPDFRPEPKVEADTDAYRRYHEEQPRLIVECLKSAAASLTPVEVLYGRAVTDKVQHNRRYHMADGKVLMDWDKPDPAQVVWRAPIDPGVQVLVFRNRKGIIAVLAQFACHATVMDSGNYLITADWPGAARRRLAGLLGGDPWVAIAQGCCGDVNPRFPRDSFEEVETKGRIVAEAALQAVTRAEPVRGDEVGSVLLPLRLPRKKPGLDATPSGEFYEGHVQALRIGDVAIVGLPGEVFCGIGLDIKAHSYFRAAFVGSYTGDYWPGYIPTASEYAAGGYEVETCAVAIGADAVLVETARRALEALKGA